MPWGEYNCGSRPLKTTRSKPDSTPKTTAAKRCTKVFIGVLRVQKDRVVTIFLFSGHRLSILPAAQPRCVSVVHLFRTREGRIASRTYYPSDVARFADHATSRNARAHAVRYEP